MARYLVSPKARRGHSFLIFTIIFFISCHDKQNENCNNPDAVNYDADGIMEKNCIFPGEKIKGAWGMRIDEYPLQPQNEGLTYSFDIRDANCYGPEKSYRYVQFYSLQSPFGPSDFCLLLKGFNFEIDTSMHITFAYALVSGTGSFANDQFVFNGTLHRLDGTDWSMKLSGGK